MGGSPTLILDAAVWQYATNTFTSNPHPTVWAGQAALLFPIAFGDTKKMSLGPYVAGTIGSVLPGAKAHDKNGIVGVMSTFSF